MPKSITLGTAVIVSGRHHDVRWLEVAVNDPLLMSVLDGLADLHEQIQPLPCRVAALVAVVGDRHPFDQLHHKVGASGVGTAPIEHMGDVWVVHQRQRLPLGLEAGDDVSRCPSRA